MHKVMEHSTSPHPHFPLGPLLCFLPGRTYAAGNLSVTASGDTLPAGTLGQAGPSCQCQQGLVAAPPV